MSEVKLEKLVEPFYKALEEGKFLGRKCPECGSVEFPPVYACNKCGCLHTEWTEISGKGVMKSIVMPAALSSKPDYKQMGKYAYGEVEIEEGACFNAVVKGITKKKRKEILEAGKLPIPVHAETFARDGYTSVVFVYDEEE